LCVKVSELVKTDIVGKLSVVKVVSPPKVNEFFQLAGPIITTSFS